MSEKPQFKQVELRFDPQKEDFDLQAIKYLLDNSAFGQEYQYSNEHEIVNF